MDDGAPAEATAEATEVVRLKKELVKVQKLLEPQARSAPYPHPRSQIPAARPPDPARLLRVAAILRRGPAGGGVHA